jgi:hypothetical protein
MADKKSSKRVLYEGSSNRATALRPRSSVPQAWQSLGARGVRGAQALRVTMRQAISRREATISRVALKIHTKFEQFRDIALFSAGVSSFDRGACMCARPTGDAAVWFAHPPSSFAQDSSVGPGGRTCSHHVVGAPRFE